jgi:LmbE family N-acetylglucosaminyl deacetylase
VLSVFAHPDDAEICAGGVMAKWAAAGREVHLVILTNGDRGSQDPAQDRSELAAIRVRETEAAAEVLGIASVRIGAIPDSELENSEEVREGVVRRIREVRAETVVTCDPTAVFFGGSYYNHSDHRTAGFVALDACYPGSGNPHFFPEQLDDGLLVQDVFDIWLGWTNEPNHREDITGFLAAKVDSLAKHDSQLSEGIRHFEESMGKEAVEAGKEIGVEHAEAFRVLDLS